MSEPGSTSGTPKRLSTLSSPSTDNFSEPFLITPASHTRPRRWLLAGSYCVLFTRYAIATFLCTFFPQYATHIGMSDTMFSAIFAAYPLGMAITSIFAAQACKWMGTRSACSFGLSATTVLTFLFGLGPTFTSSRPALEAIFLTSYFANGLLGALCETSCIITVSARFRENPGTIMASINTVCTLGCMLGPVLGGALFDAGDAAGGDAWAFRLPFFVASIIPASDPSFERTAGSFERAASLPSSAPRRVPGSAPRRVLGVCAARRRPPPPPPPATRPKRRR